MWSSWNLKAKQCVCCVTGIGKKIPTFRWGEGNTDYFLKWVGEKGWTGNWLSLGKELFSSNF